MTRRHNRAPLVILGFDAGDPGWLRDWGQDGTLPTVGRVMQRGCWGCTAGPEMISEHGMWVTLTSGVSRGRHGYYYHRQLVPGTYGLAPARGRTSGVEPFWRRLGPDRKIAIVDVPDVAAPAPQPGIQISEWATHYPYFPPSTHPPQLLDTVHRTFGRQVRIDERLASTVSEDQAMLERLLDRVQRKSHLCQELVARGDFDLTLVVFGESHTGGHQFWNYRPDVVRRKGGRPGPLADAIPRLYGAIDAAMGSLLEGLWDRANVFVLSSVGLKAQYPAAGLEPAFCHQLGYQVAAAPTPSRRERPIDRLRRAVPAPVRDRLSRLLPRQTQDRLLSDKFAAATDWDRTTVFSIPAYYAGFFRVNLKGREPRGIVAPGGEYERVLDRLEEDLRLLVDPVTGKPAIESTARASNLFGGGPPEVLPDLFAHWAEADHFQERVLHPRVELRQGRCEFHRGTDHSQRGFVAAAGPDIRGRGDLGELSPLDLAPTFLSPLGHEQMADLPGKPLFGVRS